MCNKSIVLWSLTVCLKSVAKRLRAHDGHSAAVVGPRAFAYWKVINPMNYFSNVLYKNILGAHTV